jgi:transposase
MPMPDQPKLLDIPEQPEQKPRPKHGQLKLSSVNRQQTKLVNLCVEELIAADHKARAIDQLVQRLNLSAFTGSLKTTKGCPGRAAWPPSLLLSVWVYAYSEGISSAREIERMMPWEPGLQWLSGVETVNAHTLADFRVEHKAALDELFVQLLTVLEEGGFVDLGQVMHDGTKIRAQAGADSYRREKHVRDRLAKARAVVEELSDPHAEGTAKTRKQAAQERAARERVEKMEAALAEIATQQSDKTEAADQEAVRVSVSEPEARRMKHGDNAIVPSYNAQITTESKNKVIVGAHLSQNSSDANSLMPGLEKVEQNLQKMPEQVVVDGGFTNRNNIIACAAQQIDLVGSLPDPKERSEAAMKSMGIAVEFAPHHFRILEDGERLKCPAGCSLEHVRQSVKRGDRYQQYQARGEDCVACEYQARCCPSKPERGRTVSIREEEQAAVAAFRQKMESDESKAIYRRRGEVAEFPNAWLKEKIALRKFRLRGLIKAETELLWACLTYNIQQWIRLVWRRPAVA